MTSIHERFQSFLTDSGIASEWIPIILVLTGILALSLAAIITYLITKRFLLQILNAFFRKTSFKWDDVLADRRTFDNLAHIIPALIVRAATPALFADYEQVQPIMIKIADVYILIAGALIIISFLKAVEYILSQSPVFLNKPLASYFQLVRIVFYIAMFIIILSIIIGKSPMYFLNSR